MRERVRQALRQLWRTLLAASALLLLAFAVWLAALLGLAPTERPLVESGGQFQPQDIERALALLRRHDPRWQRPGIVRAVMAEDRDVNLLMAHGAARWPGLRGRVALRDGQADLQASIDLGRLAQRSGLRWPWLQRPWVNMTVRFGAGPALPVLQRLWLGPVPVPAFLAERVLAIVAGRFAPGLDLTLLRDVVRKVELQQGRLLVFYAWQDDTSARLMTALTPAADQERLRAYAEQLARQTAHLQGSEPLTLPQLLRPLFDLARQRTASGHDAAAENRAALMMATLYAARRSLAALVPAARQWPRARWTWVTLAGRTDTPLHFLISASLAVESGGSLADAVGLYKELADARQGSGFSFHDLAADRAGTRFGDLASRDPQRLQAAWARGLGESDLLPEIDDLPESMTSEQFEARFGGVGAPAYARMVAEIEARLDTLPLLRPAPGRSR